MNINDDNINEVIYSLGNRYQLHSNKWSVVADRLAEEYNIDLSNDAIRKRYKRFKRTVNRQQSNLADMSKGELVSLAETLLVERANQAVVKESVSKPHKPDYKNNVTFSAKNVLVIADTHIPFEHAGYLEFVLRLRDRYQCDKVIHIGDILDQCAVSAWNSDPDGLTAGGELERTYGTMQKWHNALPDMAICLGNHDIRHMSLAFKTGLSTAYLRHFNEIYDVDWEWNWSYLQDNKVLYTHGSEKSGQYAHINLSKEEGLSTVIGHTHSHAGTNWFKTRTKQWFALNVGCGINESAYAFAYGQHKAYKNIIGAGLVLDHGNDPRFICYGL